MLPPCEKQTKWLVPNLTWNCTENILNLGILLLVFIQLLPGVKDVADLTFIGRPKNLGRIKETRNQVRNHCLQGIMVL